MNRMQHSSRTCFAPCLMAVLVVLAALFQPAHAADHRLVTEAVLEATLDQAWEAFTTKKGWESWAVAQAEVDFRVGGKYRTHYNPKGVIGDSRTIENTILSYDPKRMISFRCTKTPEGFPFPNAMKGMWSVAYFESVTPGRTRVTLVGLGYTDDEESQKMRKFFETGNAYSLKKLEESFAKKKTKP